MNSVNNKELDTDHWRAWWAMREVLMYQVKTLYLGNEHDCLVAQCRGRLIFAAGTSSVKGGVCTSVAELKKTIIAFIKAHNMSTARPFNWTKSTKKIITVVDRAKQINQN